ncbi:MAG TPA: galactose-1-epimerase [Bacteroidetes bacterium]|nr:galactose-1-epimerase [Bacteroidota bacterium]
MIEKHLFGKLTNGSEVYSYTLKSSSGLNAAILDYGGTVVSLNVADRNGIFADIVLGYEDVQEYVKGSSYFGAIIGRYGNRIGKGKFSIDGKTYQLSINNGVNHLHGGPGGFNKVIWKAEPIESATDPALKLTYVSKDGEEGYPGAVTLTVIYTLTKNNELRIDYHGTTDKTTILNLTHHSYFNLTGDPAKTILDHELMIAADEITPVDDGLIPTGRFDNVEGTPFDFRKPTKIGKHINDANQQIKFGKGFDHNLVLKNYDKKIRSMATLYDSTSGRFMEMFTDQPGVQFYSGNFLDGTAKGKNGVAYQFRTGLCLEAQCFPDSPNKPNFPSAVVRPGESYTQTTIYKFSTK